VTARLNGYWRAELSTARSCSSFVAQYLVVGDESRIPIGFAAPGAIRASTFPSQGL
jgi:hypothetical protein